MEDVEVTIVDDAVVDNEVLDTNNEEVDSDLNNDMGEMETNDEVNEEEFNPDDLFDEEDGKEQINYQFGAYDLSKYADTLDFENEELTSELREYADRYEQAGFTQEQIELILDDRIKDEMELEALRAKKPTKEEIKQRLVKSLTKEEIRNYRPTSHYVNDLVKGTEFEGKANEILQNPSLIKLFHIAYKKSLGRTTNIGSIKKAQDKRLKSLSYEEASDKLMDAMANGKATPSFIKQLQSNVKDTEAFDELLNALGKK